MLLIVAMMLVPWVTQAQTLDEYTFSTGTDASKWITVPTTLTSLISPGAGDYGVSTVHNLGFSFPFGEDSYTQFSVNSDGNLRFGSTVTGTSNYSTPFSSSNASVNNPKINFFGCDGYCDNSHYVRYLHTADTNGDSLGVVEFCMGTYTSTTRSYLYKKSAPVPCPCTPRQCRCRRDSYRDCRCTLQGPCTRPLTDNPCPNRLRTAPQGAHAVIRAGRRVLPTSFSGAPATPPSQKPRSLSMQRRQQQSV